MTVSSIKSIRERLEKAQTNGGISSDLSNEGHKLVKDLLEAYGRTDPKIAFEAVSLRVDLTLAEGIFDGTYPSDCVHVDKCPVWYMIGIAIDRGEAEALRVDRLANDKDLDKGLKRKLEAMSSVVCYDADCKFCPERAFVSKQVEAAQAMNLALETKPDEYLRVQDR